MMVQYPSRWPRIRAAIVVLMVFAAVSGMTTSRAMAAMSSESGALGCARSTEAFEPTLNISSAATTAWSDEWVVVSQTVQDLFDIDGVSHTVTTTAREFGGSSPSAVQDACSWSAGRDLTISDQRCGGGCVTQWMRNVYDKYINLTDGDSYWRFKEIHLWWTSTGPEMSTGSSHLVLQYQFARLCDGSGYSNVWSTDIVPYWYTPTSTYDYWWDLTNYPIMTGPIAFPINHHNTTPIYERGQYIIDADTFFSVNNRTP
jgi:hypothetical protein